MEMSCEVLMDAPPKNISIIATKPAVCRTLSRYGVAEA
jgi:hypothetical protein